MLGAAVQGLNKLAKRAKAVAAVEGTCKSSQELQAKVEDESSEEWKTDGTVAVASNEQASSFV